MQEQLPQFEGPMPSGPESLMDGREHTEYSAPFTTPLPPVEQGAEPSQFVAAQPALKAPQVSQ